MAQDKLQSVWLYFVLQDGWSMRLKEPKDVQSSSVIQRSLHGIGGAGLCNSAVGSVMHVTVPCLHRRQCQPQDNYSDPHTG